MMMPYAEFVFSCPVTYEIGRPWPAILSHYHQAGQFLAQLLWQVVHPICTW